ncbi:YheC/YheD family protein [Paenibacillus tyrfis]|uniref:ATP-grasp domain-containing protein n=1 Tax=Paenibacillus tyrfis TaxID=1501230 RepID=A0A081NW71_9BACL|nr:YheC/YheD family protein [Paenibacillus tyrfis]KEQ22694.1 hypothetical protein ET33_22605 [Paenibacillus tyrfis]
MTHTIIRSKMKKGIPLMSDPIISHHVPETNWFHASTLRRMLRAYSTLYIKPDIGRQGNGIIRIKKLADAKCEIAYGGTTSWCSSKYVYDEVVKRMNPRKKYLIQQGIELATYRKRPFDVRLVLQKPLNRWQLTWISAKVAPKATSIVTNIAKGAKDTKIIRTLKGIDQSLKPYKVLEELINVSYQVAQKLGSQFPLTIVGLDMGIDKKGKVWFIEANTRPDFKGLRKFDPVQYQRYLRAKKMLRKR